MTGNELIWVSSIFFGLTLVGWLVLDWIENAQQWEVYDTDSTENAAVVLRSQEAIDMETELLFCYPLDPFAPALLWRPMPQDEWIEAQESSAEPVMGDEPAGYLAPQTA